MSEFPTDPESLSLLRAAIVNEGGEHSGLFPALQFLASGTFNHEHSDTCEEIIEDVWDCSGSPDAAFSPQEAIVALIDALETERAEASR